MARPPRALIKGGIYHVTSRGNERQAIFRDDLDRERFLERLAESASTHQVKVYLYCLMSNHVHLLVETPLGNLNRFMGSVLTGYTVYFNRRHQRVGHLMQGRYGAQMVEGNEYLLKLSRYVHLNPVQVAAMRDQTLSERLQCLRKYPWSSYREYAGRAASGGMLFPGPVLAMVPGAAKDSREKAYARYVEAGLAKTDEEFTSLMKGHSVAIGSDTFMETIKHLHRRKAVESLKREDVSFRQIRSWKTAEEVEDAVRGAVGERWEEFLAYKAGRAVRGFTAWSLRQYAGLTQREIADRLGLTTGSAVSHMIRASMEMPEAERWRKALNSRFKG